MYEIMNIFDYVKYVKFLQKWISLQPKNGHGVIRKWSEQLNVHSTLLSQILNGKKEISLEHADQLTEILSLTERESDYFMLLVLHSRAGTSNLRKKIEKKIFTAQEESKKVSERLQVKNVLSEEAKARFYSSWIYSGIRNLSALPHMNTSEKIAEELGLPRDLVQQKLQFLLETQLCTQSDKGLTYGPARTHVSADSFWVNQHHNNWRERSQQMMHLRRESDLFFSFPMSLSNRDAEMVRKLIPVWIEQIHNIVGPSESETVRCLNIDFFKY